MSDIIKCIDDALASINFEEFGISKNDIQAADYVDLVQDYTAKTFEGKFKDPFLQKALQNKLDTIANSAKTDVIKDEMLSSKKSPYEFLTDLLQRSDESSLTRIIEKYEGAFTSTFNVHLKKDAEEILKKLKGTMGKGRADLNEKVMRGIRELRYTAKGDEAATLKKLNYSEKEIGAITNLYDALRKSQAMTFTSKKDSGLLIGFVDNYTWKNKYSIANVNAVSEKEFVDIGMEELDLDAMFSPSVRKDEKAMRDIIAKMYEGMSKGNVKSGDDVAKDIGGAALQSRTIVFKDGASEHRFMSQFGEKNDFVHVLNDEIRDNAHLLGVRSLLGSKPRNAMDDLSKHAAEIEFQRSKTLTPEERVKAKADEMRFSAKAEAAYNKVILKPQSTYGAIGKSFSIARSSVTTMLASVGITMGPQDMATIHLTAVKIGMDNAEAFKATAKTFLDVVRKNGMRDKDILRQIGYRYDLIQGGFSKRVENDLIRKTSGKLEGVHEFVNKTSSLAMKYSGADAMTEYNQQVATYVGNEAITKNFMALSKNGVDNADLAIKQMLDGMRLDEHETGVMIRNIQDLIGFDKDSVAQNAGMDKYINFDKIADLPDEKFVPRLGELKQRLDSLSINDPDFKSVSRAVRAGEIKARNIRTSLDDKLIAYMNGVRDDGVKVPVTEFRLGPKGGAEYDDAAVFFGAFTTFKDTIWGMTHTVPRALDQISQRHKGEAAGAFLAFAGLSTAMTIISDEVWSLINNKKSGLRHAIDGDPSKILFKVANNASPVPFYSDIPLRVLEGYNRGGSMTASIAGADALAGPVGGQLVQALANTMSAIDPDGSAKGLAAQAIERTPGLSAVTSNPLFKGIMAHGFGAKSNMIKDIKRKDRLHKGAIKEIFE